jgi:predicted XRE-type DNA-binding protein
MDEQIIGSSGNVFADLGFEPAETAILQLRAKLLNDLRLFLESSSLPLAEAAQKLNITESCVVT